MPKTFESIVVYEVWLLHSNCADLKCRGKDQSFIYAEWRDAAASAQRFLDGRPAYCEGNVLIERDTMSKAEYDASPDDEESPADEAASA